MKTLATPSVTVPTLQLTLQSMALYHTPPLGDLPLCVQIRFRVSHGIATTLLRLQNFPGQTYELGESPGPQHFHWIEDGSAKQSKLAFADDYVRLYRGLALRFHTSKTVPSAPATFRLYESQHNKPLGSRRGLGQD